MGTNTTGPVMNVDDIEVIGLNGSTLVECGTSLPIARRRCDGMICSFVIGTVPLQWLPGAEFDRLIDEGRVCPFESPIPLPSPAVGADAVQPLVVYLNEQFVTTGGLVLPSTWQETSCVWTRLRGEPVETWATCLPEHLAKGMLDDWAERLLVQLDRGIADTATGSNTAKLLRLADLGLCAATNQLLRWRLYLRYGAAMEPDRVRRTFDSFIQREFPTCTWKFYLKELKDCRAVLLTRPRMPPVNDVRHKLGGIAGIRRDEISLVG